MSTAATTARHWLVMRCVAIVLSLVAVSGACANENDVSADDHRHNACIAFIDALEAEKGVDAEHDEEEFEEEAERHYDDAAASATAAAGLDPKYRAFAEAMEGAGFRSVRRDGDQVVLFTTCATEQRQARDGS